MLADGEVAIGLTFNPNEAADEIAAGSLLKSVYSYRRRGGTSATRTSSPSRSDAHAEAGAQVMERLHAPTAGAGAQGQHRRVQRLDRARRRPAAATKRALFTATRVAGSVLQPAGREPHASWVRAAGARVDAALQHSVCGPPDAARRTVRLARGLVAALFALSLVAALALRPARRARRGAWQALLDDPRLRARRSPPARA